uniref:Uncharacterized protein n=1 Tax=Shewanella putrefaciens (strain 200) TaxID=399804 RepID=E6XLQ1_SHEP2
MHELWYFYIVIWAFVELIGYFRKKSYRTRMKSGAIWAVVLVSLATAGQMNPDQNIFLQLGVCFILYGVVAVIIFYSRVGLAKLFNRISNSAGRA